MKLKCISPINGSVYAERNYHSLKEAQDFIMEARNAQRSWVTKSIQERVELVNSAVYELGRMNTQIVPELAWQMGRPIRYSWEFSGVKERADHMAKIASEGLAPIEVESSTRYKRIVKRVPQGVILVIAPWNYPYMTAINTIAPALIAGNTVILKHSSQTPLVGERLEQAFSAAGIPKDVFLNLFLDHQTTCDLIASNAFDFINFTGSVSAGKSIENSASGTFTGLGLELGGKDAAYVMENANIDLAVETLMDASMYNSGQCCCGIERIYLDKSIYNEFIEKAVDNVAMHKLGDPLDPATTIGPLAQVRLANQVRKQIDDAVNSGAKTLIDPKLFPKNDGSYLMPQILVNLDHSMEIMREESFGPVVGIMAVNSENEAINLINDSKYGLTASLWTYDVNKAEKIADQIETGTVFLNRADYLDPALCWTGCKNTGRGGTLSIIGYHNLTRPKSYHLKIL